MLCKIKYIIILWLADRCMDTRSDTAVDDEFCDWTTQPVDINACHVACPGDCVLSAWSEWSTCPKVHCLLAKVLQNSLKYTVYTRFVPGGIYLTGMIGDTNRVKNIGVKILL